MSAVLHNPIYRLRSDPDALLELSLAEKWGDGLPLLPPTD